MSNKFPYGSEVNTGWYLSNCDKTIGAIRRFKFGQKLIEAGLKIHTEGTCFNNLTPKEFGKNEKKVNQERKIQRARPRTKNIHPEHGAQPLAFSPKN